MAYRYHIQQDESRVALTPDRAGFKGRVRKEFGQNWGQTRLTFVRDMEYVTIKSITGHGKNLDVRLHCYKEDVE